jgi:hypothetical protein
MDDDTAFSTIVKIQERFKQMDNNLLGEIETDNAKVLETFIYSLYRYYWTHHFCVNFTVTQ